MCQISNPFYLFQLVSIYVCTSEGYVLYSVVLVLVSLVCAMDSIYGTKKQEGVSGAPSHRTSNGNERIGGAQAIVVLQLRPGGTAGRPMYVIGRT